MSNDTGIHPANEIIAAIKAGEMVVLIDDEDRENEGDLVIAAEFANAAAINFMARHGRGLICLAMTAERAETLHLKPMAPQNGTRHQTAFTVSIEAREGVTTGISAADRARTIAVAIDSTCNARDIVSPGHVFPLVARDGGVLVRAGHTEAAVDLSRLAGLNPSGVICEIMREDGSMARLPDLIPFAREHGLKIGTIADLIAWRRRSEMLVRRVREAPFHSAFGGDFQMIVYADNLTGTEHIALIKGDITRNPAPLVRMHALNILEDVLGDTTQTRQHLLQDAMQHIDRAGSGVVVILREPFADAVSRRLELMAPDNLAPPVLRDYGVGAQILSDLGIKQMNLLSRTEKAIAGLEGYGLTVLGTVS